jgi:hypothetical protein
VTSCPFALDDGAYVLGALAPAERAEFERHLPGCSACRRSVASLAGLPGLLGRLDAATIAPAVAPPSMVPRALKAVLAQRRAERRRRIWYAVASAVGAAALAVVVGFGMRAAVLPETVPGPAPGPVLTAMRPASEHIPVSAEIGLVGVDGGTRIDMNCRYASGYDGRWTVRLIVYPIDGGPPEQVGSWTAASGEEVSLQATTHLTPEQIGRIELQRGDQTPLLDWVRI